MFQDGTNNYSDNASNIGGAVGEVIDSPLEGDPKGTFHSLGDSVTSPPDFVTVPDSYADRKLLTILTFTTGSSSNLPPVGSTFDVTITSADNPNYPTSFTDVDFVPVGFTSNTVTLTVTGPASVPEPGSLALVGLGLLTIAGYRLRRRKS